MLKIHGTYPSRVYRVLWMANELRLDYERVMTRFWSEDVRTPGFLAINPNARVPAIEDGELRLWESLAINLYLAKKYGPTLYPATTEDEARAWQWTIWAMTDLEPPVLALTVNRLFLPDEPRDQLAEAAAAQQLTKPVAVLDGWLARRPYILGAGFSVVDLNLASVLTNLHLAKVGLEEAPNVDGWLKRCLSRPAAQSTLSDRT